MLLLKRQRIGGGGGDDDLGTLASRPSTCRNLTQLATSLFHRVCLFLDLVQVARMRSAHSLVKGMIDAGVPYEVLHAPCLLADRTRASRSQVESAAFCTSILDFLQKHGKRARTLRARGLKPTYMPPLHRAVELLPHLTGLEVKFSFPPSVVDLAAALTVASCSNRPQLETLELKGCPGTGEFLTAIGSCLHLRDNRPMRAAQRVQDDRPFGLKNLCVHVSATPSLARRTAFCEHIVASSMCKLRLGMDLSLDQLVILFRGCPNLEAFRLKGAITAGATTKTMAGWLAHASARLSRFGLEYGGSLGSAIADRHCAHVFVDALAGRPLRSFDLVPQHESTAAAPLLFTADLLTRFLTQHSALVEHVAVRMPETAESLHGLYAAPTCPRLTSCRLFFPKSAEQRFGSVKASECDNLFDVWLPRHAQHLKPGGFMCSFQVTQHDIVKTAQRTVRFARVLGGVRSAHCLTIDKSETVMDRSVQKLVQAMSSRCQDPLMLPCLRLRHAGENGTSILTGGAFAGLRSSCLTDIDIDEVGSLDLQDDEIVGLLRGAPNLRTLSLLSENEDNVQLSVVSLLAMAEHACLTSVDFGCIWRGLVDAKADWSQLSAAWQQDISLAVAVAAATPATSASESAPKREFRVCGVDAAYADHMMALAPTCVVRRNDADNGGGLIFSLPIKGVASV